MARPSSRGQFGKERIIVLVDVDDSVGVDVVGDANVIIGGGGGFGGEQWGRGWARRGGRCGIVVDIVASIGKGERNVEGGGSRYGEIVVVICCHWRDRAFGWRTIHPVG